MMLRNEFPIPDMESRFKRGRREGMEFRQKRGERSGRG